MDKKKYNNDEKDNSIFEVKLTDHDNGIDSNIDINNIVTNDAYDENENVKNDLRQTKIQDRKLNSSKPNDNNDNNDKKLDELSKELMDFLKDQSKSFSISTMPVIKKENQSKPKSKSIVFNHTPQEVKEYLDRFVIKQDDAKKNLGNCYL